MEGINYMFQIILSIILMLFITFPPLISQAAELKNRDISKDHFLLSASEYDYPPFSIVRPDGTADGFSVQLLTEVTKAVGLGIKFKVGPWNKIKQALIDGNLDVLPLVSYSKERDKILDFTAPYLRMHGAIFVRKDQKSIHSETDLIDK